MQPQLRSKLHIFLGDRFDGDLDWEIIFLNFDKFQNWLAGILKSFKNKKNYSELHISEQIFKLKITYTPSIIKCHILAVIECVKILKKELEECKDNHIAVDDKIILGKIFLMQDVMMDSYTFIAHYEVNVLRKTPTVQILRRRKFLSNEIFMCSYSLLRRHFLYDDITLSSVPVFLIRQSIETKIVNMLGIEEITDFNNEQIKFKLDEVIDFIVKCEKIKFPIEKSILLKIFKWSNFYIHKGVMLYHWQILWAQKVLNPIFECGEGKSEWSFFGAVKIDKDFYDNNLRVELLKLPSLTKGVNVVFSGHPEAIIEVFD